MRTCGGGLSPGMRFGAWQVIGKPQKDDGAWKALCQCACGTIRFVLVSNLLRGLSRSCGCASRRANSRRAEDLTGRRFGTLVVKGQAQQKIHDRNAWICQCDCGAICVVPGKALKSGHRKSCGAPAHRLERGMLQLAGKRIGNLTDQPAFAKGLCHLGMRLRLRYAMRIFRRRADSWQYCQLWLPEGESSGGDPHKAPLYQWNVHRMAGEAQAPLRQYQRFPRRIAHKEWKMASVHRLTGRLSLFGHVYGF